MEMSEKNDQPTSSTDKEKGNSKKYNFYRKPSIKKKVPEVKQTRTSYKRMLIANPLLKYELEGKDLALLTKHSQESVNGNNNAESMVKKNLPTEKQSLHPSFKKGKQLNTQIQNSHSLKNPTKLSRSIKQATPHIISGSKQLASENKSSNISRQSTIDFNPTTPKFLSSTRLENNSKIQTTKDFEANYNKTEKNKNKMLTKENCVSGSINPKVSEHKDKLKKHKPIRRSLSAQHFHRKKGGTAKFDQQNCFSRARYSQSLEDVSKDKPPILQHCILPIAEGNSELSMIFKTPSAYERRSIVKSTPKSILSTRRSLYNPVTPLPSLIDLQMRLNNWLIKRGKSLSSFHHLKCFGIEDKESEVIDEENKENIEVAQNFDKGSYEDLKIDCVNYNCNPETETNKPLALNDENTESVAKAALEDLHRLIQDGYPGPQCEGWLELIRQKYRKVEEEPQYWECRAAIEQSRGNISNAVQCYRTAIVQGAEIQSVDESLDVLLRKFSLLNISTTEIENEKSIKERARIVKDARNVFKSSIIQFAVQERKLKKDGNVNNEKKLIATPVRRSTRLSRSAYTLTPGVKICSSLQELDTSDRETLDFKKNKALF